MPRIEVAFYAEGREAPALEWLLGLPEKVQDKLRFAIRRLGEEGHVLRRPLAAPLQEKIYELRVRHQQVNYRLLYFFHGNLAAIVAHGCTKEGVVDAGDIERASRRRHAFLLDPAGHTLNPRE